MTAIFTDCPVPAQPATCIGYAVNARNLTEEVGERQYHDELVWVDAAAVTIDASGIHVSPVPLLTSRTDDNPPRFGGMSAKVRIDGAVSGRVRATVTLRRLDDGSTHVAKLDVRVVGGALQTFTGAGGFSLLCPSGSATGRLSGVFSDPATTAGTMTVDGVALKPVPAAPGVQPAQLNSDRFAGTCDNAAATAGT